MVRRRNGTMRPTTQGFAPRRSSPYWLLCVVSCAITLSGCDQLGIETPVKAAEREHADAKAVGGACRHALRAIEDCYVLNPKSDKSAAYEGWREMDEYMRENKLEGVVPVVPRPAASSASAPKKKPAAEDDGGEDTSTEDAAADEPASKPAAKAGAKVH
jgi:hypothetical protein